MGLYVFILLLCLLLDVASTQTYYKRLGVKPTATEKEIKKAYRKMAMKVWKNYPICVKLFHLTSIHSMYSI